MSQYHRIGYLKTGEPIFFSSSLGVAVEKDNEYLVEPTPDERDQIREFFPELFSYLPPTTPSA